jgi:hypothetical protein
MQATDEAHRAAAGRQLQEQAEAVEQLQARLREQQEARGQVGRGWGPCWGGGGRQHCVGVARNVGDGCWGDAVKQRVASVSSP